MKKILFYIGTVVLFIGIVAFFWPRSLADMNHQPKSVRIEIIESDALHSRMTIEIPAESPELDEIIDLLDQYSYHYSLRTIPSLLDNGPSMEGNDAGFWLNIYLYSEPNYMGECFSITSGGTREIIWGDAVWGIGYWGNSRNLQLMDDFYELLISYQEDTKHESLEMDN